MQLTIFTDYGLRTLMYLAAQPEKLSSVREISEHYDISRHHLVKVVHRLSQLGYVATSKGKSGGIRLACEARKVKLGDLIRKLEPNMRIVECFDQATNTCTVVSGCRLKHLLFKANQSFLQTLNGHTLADTIKDSAIFLQAPV